MWAGLSPAEYFCTHVDICFVSFCSEQYKISNPRQTLHFPSNLQHDEDVVVTGHQKVKKTNWQNCDLFCFICVFVVSSFWDAKGEQTRSKSSNCRSSLTVKTISQPCCLICWSHMTEHSSTFYFQSSVTKVNVFFRPCWSVNVIFIDFFLFCFRKGCCKTKK